MCHIIFLYGKCGSLPLFCVSLDSSEKLCKYFVILNFRNHANVTEAPVFGCKVNYGKVTHGQICVSWIISLILRALFVRHIIRWDITT